MDVFALRQSLVDDFRHYAESFLTIRDERVKEHVQRELDAGLLWPDPPLQLNPAFEPGHTIQELVAEGYCTLSVRGSSGPASPRPIHSAAIYGCTAIRRRPYVRPSPRAITC